MMMKDIKFEKILIPIDGSTSSFNAVFFTMKFLDIVNFDSKITICHVISDSIVKQLAAFQAESTEQIKNKYRTQAENFFKRIYNEARKRNFPKNFIETEILYGDPAEEIVKFSKNYDLIVIASRGKKKVPQYMVGHVTERIIKMSKIPVLVIPPEF